MGLRWTANLTSRLTVVSAVLLTTHRTGAARAEQLALQTAQFLQRICRWAVGIGTKDDYMLSTRMGNVEPIAMKAQLTDNRVAHMR